MDDTDNLAGTIIKMVGPLLVVLWGFYSFFGGPLNWWVPFFGLDMKANKDKIGLREQKGEDSQAIQTEIAQWVAGMSKGRYYKVNPYTYRFLRKADAMMFKLVWS